MSRDILLSLIDPDPGQARKVFDAGRLAELAQSMAASGQAVPVLLRPGQDGRFVLVHGERRWRAAQLLGWETLRAEVQDLPPDQARWLALVENLQRADLSPIEEAQAYQAALAGGLTQAALGQKVGKSQSYIAQKLRLLTLPADVQEALCAGQLSEGQARQLLRLRKDSLPPEWISNAARQCLQGGWSVRRLELQIDFELMVTVARQWPEIDAVGYKFGDLVELDKRLEAAKVDPKRNPYDAEIHVRVERALGKHFAFGELLWETYGLPGLALYLCEEADLSTWTWAEQMDSERQAVGIGTFDDWLKWVSLPGNELDELGDQWIAQATFPTTRQAYYEFVIPRAVAYFDQRHEVPP